MKNKTEMRKIQKRIKIADLIIKSKAASINLVVDNPANSIMSMAAMAAATVTISKFADIHSKVFRVDRPVIDKRRARRYLTMTFKSKQKKS